MYCIIFLFGFKAYSHHGNSQRFSILEYLDYMSDVGSILIKGIFIRGGY